MVFQNYALYPHMTVNENLSFPLKIAHVPSAQIQHRVHEVASVLDIEQLLDRKPRALSGGQRQRVAMGRAIVRSPHVFLMDEPLSNLDAKLRTQTRTQIAALQRRLRVTTVYVTHDQVEAMTMGDRVAVLRDGVLQQVGAPKDLYEQPDNMFVAGFMGSPAMNLLELPATDGGVHFGDFFYPVERDTMTGSGSRVVLGVRPEDLEPDEHGLAFEVEAVEVLGADAYVYGRAVGTGDANKGRKCRCGKARPEHGTQGAHGEHPGNSHARNASTMRRSTGWVRDPTRVARASSTPASGWSIGK
jgi:multiple sugar transport system ATP-binding protein